MIHIISISIHYIMLKNIKKRRLLRIFLVVFNRFLNPWYITRGFLIVAQPYTQVFSLFVNSCTQHSHVFATYMQFSHELLYLTIKFFPHLPHTLVLSPSRGWGRLNLFLTSVILQETSKMIFLFI